MRAPLMWLLRLWEWCNDRWWSVKYRVQARPRGARVDDARDGSYRWSPTLGKDEARVRPLHGERLREAYRAHTEGTSR